jgi:hypothetical protein
MVEPVIVRLHVGGVDDQMWDCLGSV